LPPCNYSNLAILAHPMTALVDWVFLLPNLEEVKNVAEEYYVVKIN
jgi:hypothetical protein